MGVHIKRKRNKMEVQHRLLQFIGIRSLGSTHNADLFLSTRIGEPKNRTIKENGERKILTCICSFNILLSYSHFFLFFFLFYYCFLALRSKSSESCGCRRGRHLLARSSPNDIRYRKKKRQGNMKMEENEEILQQATTHTKKADDTIINSTCAHKTT